MRKLFEKLRLWILSKLRAVPEEDYIAMCRDNLHLETKLRKETTEHLRLISRFDYAVREICRRSEYSYYDWCCDFCAARGEKCKADGWCASF